MMMKNKLLNQITYEAQTQYDKLTKLIFSSGAGKQSQKDFTSLKSLRFLRLYGAGTYGLNIPMDIVALSISESKITSVSMFANLTKLRFLDLSKNYLTDCSPLKYLINLEHLNISQYE